jgi:hypothetical protein
MDTPGPEPLDTTGHLVDTNAAGLALEQAARRLPGVAVQRDGGDAVSLQTHGHAYTPMTWGGTVGTPRGPRAQHTGAPSHR